MFAVVRTYTGPGATKLFDVIEERKRDVEAVIRDGVPGLESYTLLRTSGGGVAVTVAQDQAGAEASIQLARDWIAKNAAEAGASAPAVAQGTVILHI